MIEDLFARMGEGMAIILFVIVIGVMILVSIGIYIYTSFAFMRIGQKAKYDGFALAWIPGIGPILVAFFADKNKSMPWWIMLGSIAGYFIGIIFLALQERFSVIFLVLGGIILILAIAGFIYFLVYTYIWTCKLFEKIKRPGWWALIPLFGLPFSLLGLIPFLGLIFQIVGFAFTIWYLVVIGIAAWSNPN